MPIRLKLEVLQLCLNKIAGSLSLWGYEGIACAEVYGCKTPTHTFYYIHSHNLVAKEQVTQTVAPGGSNHQATVSQRTSIYYVRLFWW
jgi:hypothetical protein